MRGALRALVVLQVLLPLCAVAADEKVRIELNSIESADNRCRLNFIVEYRSHVAIESMKLDLVTFATDGAILLVRQVYRNHWGIPGGLLKRGEDPTDAARREVFEEIGIAIELVGEPAVVVDAVPQRIDIVYRARPVTLSELDHVRPHSPEIGAVQWFAPDSLPELQEETASALVALARSSASPQSMPLPR